VRCSLVECRHKQNLSALHASPVPRMDRSVGPNFQLSFRELEAKGDQTRIGTSAASSFSHAPQSDISGPRCNCNADDYLFDKLGNYDLLWMRSLWLAAGAGLVAVFMRDERSKAVEVS
jgi:hypothetical protein